MSPKPIWNESAVGSDGTGLLDDLSVLLKQGYITVTVDDGEPRFKITAKGRVAAAMAGGDR